MVVLYWALGQLSESCHSNHKVMGCLSSAFVIGSAIPQIQTISALIASVAIMQFSYTFPFLLRAAYDVITDAMIADKTYVPGQGTSGRIDTWSDWSRWRRVSSEILLPSYSNVFAGPILRNVVLQTFQSSCRSCMFGNGMLRYGSCVTC